MCVSGMRASVDKPAVKDINGTSGGTQAWNECEMILTIGINFLGYGVVILARKENGFFRHTS